MRIYTNVGHQIFITFLKVSINKIDDISVYTVFFLDFSVNRQIKHMSNIVFISMSLWCTVSDSRYYPLLAPHHL